MPFDGTVFCDLPDADTGIFREWSLDRFRFWLKSFRAGRRGEIGCVLDRRAQVICLLEDAKAMIANEAQWVRGAYWRFPNRRCAIGALRATARRREDVTLAWSAHALLLQVADRRCFSSVEAMNDHSSHADVLGGFDEALALARSSWR